jgi:hypothetical protein
MSDTILAYIISLGIIGAGVGWSTFFKVSKGVRAPQRSEGSCQKILGRKPKYLWEEIDCACVAQVTKELED